MTLVVDCSNANEHSDLVKHCWMGFESVTIGGLLKINRQTCGDTIDVLNGLIDAGIDLMRHLDWKVRARIVNSSQPPTLEKDGDNWKVKFEPDNCVALVLRVEMADGGLVTYMTPNDLDRFGQASWVPAWTIVHKDKHGGFAMSSLDAEPRD